MVCHGTINFRFKPFSHSSQTWLYYLQIYYLAFWPAHPILVTYCSVYLANNDRHKLMQRETLDNCLFQVNYDPRFLFYKLYYTDIPFVVNSVHGGPRPPSPMDKRYKHVTFKVSFSWAASLLVTFTSIVEFSMHFLKFWQITLSYCGECTICWLFHEGICKILLFEIYKLMNKHNRTLLIYVLKQTQEQILNFVSCKMWLEAQNQSWTAE